MRCDGEPYRRGVRPPRRMSRASQPDKQNGTLSADTIRASGLVRPHQKAGHKTAPDQNAKNIESTLAMREPSTQGHSRLGEAERLLGTRREKVLLALRQWFSPLT